MFKDLFSKTYDACPTIVQLGQSLVFAGIPYTSLKMAEYKGHLFVHRLVQPLKRQVVFNVFNYHFKSQLSGTNCIFKRQGLQTFGIK